MSSAPPTRKMPIGAEWLGAEHGVDFRVWAPRRSSVEVVFEGALPPLALDAQGHGYFAGRARQAKVGARYRFRLDGEAGLYPDPASRAQPEGPHGPSEVVDSGAFAWTDGAWKGISRTGQVLYEMHLGTFTREGSWRAAQREIAELRSLGVTIVEVMPIAEFPGKFGWGYDGVDLFAPTRLYGTPDDVRRFVDAAHALGLGVILDVVYNHFGPDGNYLSQFSETYFTERHVTDWGAAINYDGDGSEGVRELVTSNAAYWIDEFHFDGLRLDATQNIYDDSEEHILVGVNRAVRAAAKGRGTYIAAENEMQQAKLVRDVHRRGYGLDALWNDDLHHTLHVALTEQAEAYYFDYGGTPQEIVSALKWGYLYQGQHYAWQQQRRGNPALDLDPPHFITFLENHDQVANSATGARLHQLSNASRHRALVAVMLLGPGTPLLFQGEEFASSSPFLFFADHNPELAQLVSDGRRKFLAQFPSIAASAVALPLPHDVETFERCKLDFRERASHAATYSMYRELLALRRSESAIREPARRVDGAVVTTTAFVLRFFGSSPDDDRLLVVNLGASVVLARAPEPLLAPPERKRWEPFWSSEDPRYGGAGTSELEIEGVWHIPGECAVLLRGKGRSPMNLSRRLVLTDPVDVAPADPHDDPILSREWLVTNGLGGYASGTVSGAITRRFHGLLIAALPAPLGRVMMLNHLAEQVNLEDGPVLALDAQERPPSRGASTTKARLLEFVMEAGLPVWRYDLGRGHTVEKRLVMPHGQNTALMSFELASGEGTLHLELEPWLNFRAHEASLELPIVRPYAVTETGNRYEISAGGDFPTLRLRIDGTNGAFFVKGRKIENVTYGIEASRGYDAKGDLYAPGVLRADLRSGESVTLAASTEPWAVVDAAPFRLARTWEAGRRARLAASAGVHLGAGVTAELVLAADQFVIDPPGRLESGAVTRACGEDVCSVIAGYPWFTDWGRDTMISLEGLTLVTGRFADARNILASFSRHVRDGLIPNMFPEGTNAGLYHTADASLWFFHAVDRYLTYTRDTTLLTELLPTLVSIAEHHEAGTKFGIRVDPRDGLLTQGSPDLPLTWMDAKVGDLVVTPRRGKAVELNGLYYNALTLLASWVTAANGAAAGAPYATRAERLATSFNARFWYADGGYLYDIVDGDAGDDHALRPNQLLALSLPNPVLTYARWASVVARCEASLVTPLGLRSLARSRARLQARLLRRSTRPRSCLSSGHGLGLADRTVRRCVAQSASRSDGQGAHLSRGFRSSHERGVRWVRERGL